MDQSDWRGVFPAMTTPFKEDLSVDYEAVERQAFWLISSGCAGLVALGSLGESPTLSAEEKAEILRACRRAMGGRVPLIAGISGLGTPEAVALAKVAEEVGCDGLMVLPPYVYRGDWRETEAHLSAVISATPLSSMLYNNPIAYGTDVTPEQLKQLVCHSNLHAVKESSGDIRRVTALQEVLGDRLAIFVGMDDVVVESVAAGAVGWIAGLVNALPAESVRLFELAKTGGVPELRELYEWFLPLLRLDTVPKFVQLIKLVQAEVGKGSARVRPPRLELTGAELEQARHLIQERLERQLVQAI
jgi:dihydrodipicolinate synthase/N-acetylneuraminate lyase